MHVTPIVNKGLSFDLNYYQELKTSHSGTIFWYVDNSKLLRTKLAPFLPRMEYDAGTATVTASIVENGHELLSTSEAATPSLNNVPTSELQKLESLINELLVEASKPDTPDNVKQLISAFPLPKPNSMPECYRLYGKGPNKKLAIVWGLARKDADGKEDVSSVVALKDFTYGLEYTPKKSYTWLWVLLGIAAAGIAIYCTNGNEGSTTNSNTPTDTPPIAAPPKPDEEIPVVVEQALPAPQKIEVLKAKEATVNEEIAAIEAKQAELKEKLETMDQQSAEAAAARSELDSLLARHADLMRKLDAIKSKRMELENTPEVVPDPEPTPPVDILTVEEQKLPVPQKIEVLKAKEATVNEEIAAIEAKQAELKEKLETMDQQSAEAAAARSELDSLLARHADLMKKLDAIKSKRMELENTPEVVPAPEPPPFDILTEEEQKLPVPQKIKILKEKEATVTQEIAELETKPTELKEKLATLDPQSAEAAAARSEIDSLPARHADLKEKLNAIKSKRTELENTPEVVPDPEPTPPVDILTVEEQKLPVPQKIEILKEKEATVTQEIAELETKPTELKEKLATLDPQSAEAAAARSEIDSLPARHADLKEKLNAIKTTRMELENTPEVVPAPEPPPFDILTEEEQKLPAEEQLAILDKKEQAVRTEVKKLETEQKTLQSEIDSILATQAQNTADVQLLKTLVEEYETLAAKLGSEDISDEERNQLKQQKTALDEQITAAKQRLGTEAYSINKERLSDIDEQLTELKKKSAQIDSARKALQAPEVTTGPTPPEVVQKVVNVVINQSTDYKVTYVSNTPIADTDKILVKLNVTSLKSGLKFSKVTIADKEVDANGDVELELQDSGTQELQLKIWVNNNAEPKYSAPIPVSTSVTE